MLQPKKTTNEIFAANLRARMDALGVTQETISTDLGISQSAISNYLKGRVPRYEILSELANYLAGSSVDDLVGKETPTAEKLENRVLRESLTYLSELKQAVADVESSLRETEKKLQDVQKLISKIDSCRSDLKRKK